MSAGPSAEKPELLKLFFAVTEFGVYRIDLQAEKNRNPSITKIAQKNHSQIPVDQTFNDGNMLCIYKSIGLFFPDDIGTTSSTTATRRDIACNKLFRGTQTAKVVALFFDEESARTCYRESNLTPCDPRWEDKTIAVLKAIGENHPFCSISTADQNYWLMPPEKWH